MSSLKIYDPTEACPKCSGVFSHRKWISMRQMGETIGSETGILVAHCNECDYEVQRQAHDVRAIE